MSPQMQSNALQWVNTLPDDVEKSPGGQYHLLSPKLAVPKELNTMRQVALQQQLAQAGHPLPHPMLQPPPWQTLPEPGPAESAALAPPVAPRTKPRTIPTAEGDLDDAVQIENRGSTAVGGATAGGVPPIPNRSGAMTATPPVLPPSVQQVKAKKRSLCFCCGASSVVEPHPLDVAPQQPQAPPVLASTPVTTMNYPAHTLSMADVNSMQQMQQQQHAARPWCQQMQQQQHAAMDHGSSRCSSSLQHAMVAMVPGQENAVMLPGQIISAGGAAPPPPPLDQSGKPQQAFLLDAYEGSSAQLLQPLSTNSQGTEDDEVIDDDGDPPDRVDQQPSGAQQQQGQGAQQQQQQGGQQQQQQPQGQQAQPESQVHQDPSRASASGAVGSEGGASNTSQGSSQRKKTGFFGSTPVADRPSPLVGESTLQASQAPQTLVQGPTAPPADQGPDRLESLEDSNDISSIGPGGAALKPVASPAPSTTPGPSAIRPPSGSGGLGQPPPAPSTGRLAPLTPIGSTSMVPRAQLAPLPSGGLAAPMAPRTLAPLGSPPGAGPAPGNPPGAGPGPAPGPTTGAAPLRTYTKPPAALGEHDDLDDDLEELMA
eukprot:gene19042-25640_t